MEDWSISVIARGDVITVRFLEPEGEAEVRLPEDATEVRLPRKEAEVLWRLLGQEAGLAVERGGEIGD